MSLRCRWLLVLCALSAHACTLSLSVDEPQCESDGDCAKRGFQGAVCQQQLCIKSDPLAADPQWGCGLLPKKQPTGDYTVTISFIDALSREPLPEVALTACSDRDTNCIKPQGTAVTGADGSATMTFPRTFVGYVESRKMGYLDALTYIIPAEGTSTSPPVTLVSPEVFDAVAEAQGTKREKGTGMIFALVLDCQGKPAAGVSVSSNPLAPVRFYYEGQLPTLSRTSTDSTGQSGLLNFSAPTPQLISLTGVLVEQEREVARGQVLVRADTITNYPLTP